MQECRMITLTVYCQKSGHAFIVNTILNKEELKTSVPKFRSLFDNSAINWSKMPKTKKDQSSSDSDSGPEDRNPPAKKAKESGGKDKSKTNDEASNCWVLDKQRQVRINEFRGRKLIDIREYYEKDGQMLPGKKGISLSVEQWKKLLKITDEVNSAIERI